MGANKDNLLKINIFYTPNMKEEALQISYGIEEEGLPYKIVLSNDPFRDALEDTISTGLGVAIGINSDTVGMFSSQFKKEGAFMESRQFNNHILRAFGQNASRIIKRKPFIQAV